MNDFPPSNTVRRLARNGHKGYDLPAYQRDALHACADAWDRMNLLAADNQRQAQEIATLKAGVRELEARRGFAEKDYQDTLWKLHREEAKAQKLETDLASLREQLDAQVDAEWPTTENPT